MRIYIWEGNGISSAYHDDGTLVVLAETVEQAREAVRADKVEHARELSEWQEARRVLADELGIPLRVDGAFPMEFFRHPDVKAWDAKHPMPWYREWDGTDEALDRDPDRVIDILADTPAQVVAFNGGGYD